MENKAEKSLIPLAWVFYIFIVFEALIMITPFALYYYSAYGPVINFFNKLPQSHWLSSFFLPHFTQSNSWILSSLMLIGMIFFTLGFIIFLAGAGQIYYSKLAKKGAVTGGLYKYVRHPQYTAFITMGFGVLLIMPRFIVLITFVTMIFIYYFLARKEEKECEEKYGEKFKQYTQNTAMFLPVKMPFLKKLPSLPPAGYGRKATVFSLYGATVAFTILFALVLRNYSLSTLSVHFSDNMVTVSTAQMEKDKMQRIIDTATGNAEVKNILKEAGYDNGEKFLNYIVPQEWYLSDLPLETRPEWANEGHFQPKDYNRDTYKVLFTKAVLSGDGNENGSDIIKKTVMRIPLIVVKLNSKNGEITGLEDPPEHARGVDVPMPLF